MALILGLFFLRQNYDQRGLMNINGAMFIFLVNLTVQNAFAVVNVCTIVRTLLLPFISFSFVFYQVFCSELPVFLREHNSGMYRVDAYFVCKNLAEVCIPSLSLISNSFLQCPVFVAIPIVAATVNYYMIGYNPAPDAFLYMIVVGIFVSLAGVSYGKATLI